jgi:tetratricopeptide (TPR) repeat protein
MAACVFLALAGIAGGVGWAVRDRMAQQDQQRLREEALDKAVETALADTEPLIQQERWPEALAVVGRAEQLLQAADRTDRPQRLIDLRKELLMARRPEEIYHEPKQELHAAASLAGVDGTMYTRRRQQDPSEEDFFWGREQDRRFSRAFREFGIDMEALGTEEAAARIRATSIRQASVQSLDAWAAMRKRAKGIGDGFWKKLLEVAQQADPDEWRNRFREALLRRDRAALEKLADEIPIREVPPATVYVLGHALRELGALDKTMVVLRQAHHRHPEDFWLNDALGHFSKDYCRPPRYDDALRHFSVTVALRPHNWHPHRSVAWLLEKKGATEEAIAEYAEMVALDPQNPQVWVERGKAYQRLHQYDKAVDDLTKAIELDPKLTTAWTNRGSAYLDLRQDERAIADYSKAIELDSKRAGAWYNRGRAHYILQQYDKVVADASKAIELDPKYVLGWHFRGAAYDKLHQHNKAVADYSKIIELEPRNALAWSNRSFAHERLRQYDKAVSDASKAIELDPKFVFAWDNRGVVYIKLRQYEKAVADCSKAIELDPKFVHAWHHRGVAYDLLHQYDKAVPDYSKAIKLDPKFAATHNVLAWVLATCPSPNLRDPQRAVELAKKAVELTPSEGNYWNTLGTAHYHAGDWNAAVPALKKSMDLRKGGNSFDWFLLAMAYWQLGDKEQARRWYDKAVPWMDKNDPKNDELRRFRSEAAELLGMKTKSD